MKKKKKNKSLITPLGYEVQFCKKLDPKMKKIKKKNEKNKIWKGGSVEIELMVQIGILGCLVFIIWFLKAWDVVNTKYWEALYTKLDEIKEKIDYLKKL